VELSPGRIIMIEIEIQVAQPIILNKKFHQLDDEFKAGKSSTTPPFAHVEREVNGTIVKIRYDFPASEMSNVSRTTFENIFKSVIAPGKVVEIREV